MTFAPNWLTAKINAVINNTLFTLKKILKLVVTKIALRKLELS